MNQKPSLKKPIELRLLEGEADYKAVFAQEKEFNINFHPNPKFPTIVAFAGTIPVGFIQVKMNAPYSAEIYTLGTRYG